jgi:hypothetical protein
MRNNPTQCRKHAARCEELAKTADTLERATVLRNLAEQWLNIDT